MGSELFDSAVRTRGDLAGVFEYDGDTAYFYLYDVARPPDKKIVGSIHVFSGRSSLRRRDVEVRWDNEEDRVALFLRGEQWAVFNVATGKKYGGNYSPDTKPQIPSSDTFR